jgi:hypothetical protein
MSDAQPEPRVGGIEKRATIATAQVNAVLGLQTAPRYHKAGIGNVWPVGGYLIFISGTVVSGGRGGETCECEQATCRPKA